MDDVEGLARGTDREVADWRTTLNNHTKTINAWGQQLNARFDQVEAEMRGKFAKVDERFDQVEAEMRDGFGKLAKGQKLITQLLNKHLGKPDDETQAGGAGE